MKVPEPLIEFFVEAALPLRMAVIEPVRLVALFRDIGWGDQLDVGIAEHEPLATLFDAMTPILKALDELIDEARDGAWTEDDLAAVLKLAVQLLRLVTDLRDIPAARISKGLPPTMRAPEFWRDFAVALPEYLWIRQLSIATPLLLAVLELVGVVEVVPGQGSSSTALAPGRRRFAWERLGPLIKSPARTLSEYYHWGDGQPLDHVRLLNALSAVASAVDLDVRAMDPPAAVSVIAAAVPGGTALGIPLYQGRKGGRYAELGVVLVPIPPAGRPGDLPSGLMLTNWSIGTVEAARRLGRDWVLEIGGKLDASGSLQLCVWPDEVKLAVELPSSSLSTKLAGVPEKPWCIGDPQGVRLEVGGFHIGLEILQASGRPEFVLDLAFVAKTPGAGIRLIFDPGDGDGFLAELLRRVRIEGGFDLGARWSSRTGFSLSGSAELAVELATDVALGPLRLRGVRVALGVHKDGVRLAGGFGVVAELGPFTATVTDIGLGLDFAPAADGSGTLGPFDAGIGFKPPTGIGFAIDSETVKGGGFLSFDVEAGRYAGVLELVTPSFGLTALGILTTKIPGEPKGWSLFFALTASFNPGIQLGFGFVLTGVGGLFAVNRRLDEPAMRTAVRGGNLDSVLFPTDVVKEAPRIFATVESMFPIAKGSFVFGPMIKIGWGSPTLIEAMIGVFVSLPSPVIIALLGRVRLALPADKPILVINMDIAGSINFGAGTVGLDAQIHDSTLFELELTGGMAFRARFKEQPSFLLSVGGFHPAFEPPADVGPLARMGMSLRLGKQENILITLRSYFALTSNTLQFGAGIDVSAQIMNFKIYGGAYFDALIVYRPFHFTAGMGAYFGVTWRKWEVLAVRVALMLDGPGPWRARGEASFTIVGFELSFEFDETFGDKIAASEERAPVRGPLVEALAEPRNWGAEPSGFDSLRLRDLLTGTVDPTHIVIAPGDRLAFRQRVAPLNVTLEQMGSVEPQERGPFAVKVLRLGERAPEPGQVTVVDELFAPAAYFDKSDAERLSAPSFEAMAAGVAVGSGYRAPPAAQRYTVVDGSFESIGGLWPEDTSAPLDTSSERFAALLHRDPDGWKRRRDQVVVAAAPRFVRVAENSLTPVDEAEAWHVVRARRATGERILPAHAARKSGR